MNPSLILGFQVHHPLRFVDEGQAQDEEKAFKHMVHSTYAPFIELLQTLIQENPSFRAFCCISGDHIKHLKAQNHVSEELLSYWEKLISTGRIQAITEPFQPNIGTFRSQRNLFDQVLKHHIFLREHFHEHNRSLRLLRHYKWEKSANIAGLLGFQTILLEGQFTDYGHIPKAPMTDEDMLIIHDHAPLDAKHHLHLNHKRPEALVYNQKLTELFWELFHDGLDGEVAAQAILHRLKSSHLESFILDIEEFGTHPQRERAFEFLYDLINELILEGVTLYKPDEWLQIAQEKELNTDCFRHELPELPETLEKNHVLESAYKELTDTIDLFSGSSSNPLAWHYLAHDTKNDADYFIAHHPFKKEDEQYKHFEDFLKNMRSVREVLEKLK